MSIVSNFIANMANKAAEKIAGASQLTASQIEKIEAKKQSYLAEKKNLDPNSEEAKKIISRIFGTLGVEVYHAYIPKIDDIYTPIKITPKEFDVDKRIACFDITKWVLDAEENYLDKLVNVYQVLSDEECSIALIFDRNKSGCTVTMAIVNNCSEEDPNIASTFKNRLQEAVSGNFPGVVFSNNNGKGIPKCLKEYEDQFNSGYQDVNIASVTNIATEKSEKFISQSIEKLLDGVVPRSADEKYTFMLLATPSLDIDEDKSRISEIYSVLSPYSSWQTNYTYTTSDNESSSFVGGVNLGTTAGGSIGSGITNSLAKTISNSVGGSANGEFGIGKIVKVGASANYNHTRATTNSTADTHNTGFNLGANFGVNFNRSSNVSINVGKNEGITYSVTNHQIKHTLELLDRQMKRLEQSSALGMWKFASYIISRDYNTTNNAAHMYLALTQGEESFLSQSAVNIWHSEKKDKIGTMLYEISRLQHPVFCLNEDLDESWLMYPTTVDATTTISGRELAYAFNLPRKSVAGFPVIECAEFGRNIVTYDDKFKSENKIGLGKIFHMHHKEEIDIELSVNSLASHTFITGSTGSGKSNTIYKILADIKHQKIPFLVVEPAKGEYKHIFGNEQGVSVYGTNPQITPLLRLNPFSFPEDVHILEHLDRLVEIFNVCWPMYAAMPAVLKNAVEKAYEDCGWNLTESLNDYGRDMYPTFVDVARNVRSIIDSSEYDAENKGAYKGSLLTRLHSLTNGINGMIFTADELSEQELFDKNVVIDLSRIGSNETKSLIMGMIVLKLQEYRMTSGNINSALNHVTVLEEAHNLLKRTSSEQSSESANLLGKSVEMIANAIAEMRTYGEGFIIADQAPALLDMSVIRNTNTKIIMRLPDMSDRELVGKSANLNDNQVKELAKLPCGVAAVYQNEWIQPVLCQVDKYGSNDGKYTYSKSGSKAERIYDGSSALKIAELLCNGTKLSSKAVYSNILPQMKEMGISSSTQVAAVKMLLNPPDEPKFTKLAPVIGALFPYVRQSIKETISTFPDERKWTESADSALRACINNMAVNNKLRRDIIQAIMTDYLYVELGKKDELQRWIGKGGLI